MLNPWLAITFQTMRLGFEAQNAVTLRLMRLVGDVSKTDARSTIADKAAAPPDAQEAATKVASILIGGATPAPKSIKSECLPTSDALITSNSFRQASGGWETASKGTRPWLHCFTYPRTNQKAPTGVGNREANLRAFRGIGASGVESRRKALSAFCAACLRALVFWKPW
jgi:hypothetical protein